jgi:hypothetical protein
VAEIIEPPSDLALACGMSVGYADPTVPRPVMPRAQLCDVVTFVVDTGASEEDVDAIPNESAGRMRANCEVMALQNMPRSPPSSPKAADGRTHSSEESMK